MQPERAWPRGGWGEAEAGFALRLYRAGNQPEAIALWDRSARAIRGKLQRMGAFDPNVVPRALLRDLRGRLRRRAPVTPC